MIKDFLSRGVVIHHSQYYIYSLLNMLLVVEDITTSKTSRVFSASKLSVWPYNLMVLGIP